MKTGFPTPQMDSPGSPPPDSLFQMGNSFPSPRPASNLRSLIAASPKHLGKVFGPEEIGRIRTLTDLAREPVETTSIAADPDLLRDVDILFGTWGMPVLTEKLLSSANRLKAILYAAGTIKSFVTDAVWDRKILVSSACSANAVPVAEYCLAAILFSLKLGWRQCRSHWVNRHWHAEPVIPGAFGSTVGLISYGEVARMTRQLLHPFALNVMVYCPYLTSREAEAAGVRLASLEEIFQKADVVSLHTPELPATLNLVRGAHFRMMKENATFINTARGQVINESEMLEVLQARSDLTAILDVTQVEPPPPGDLIFQIPNIFLTPHIAGAQGAERRRLGQFAVSECMRLVRGEPLKGIVLKKDLSKIA